MFWPQTINHQPTFQNAYYTLLWTNKATEQYLPNEAHWISQLHDQLKEKLFPSNPHLLRLWSMHVITRILNCYEAGAPASCNKHICSESVEYKICFKGVWSSRLVCTSGGHIAVGKKLTHISTSTSNIRKKTRKQSETKSWSFEFADFYKLG